MEIELWDKNGIVCLVDEAEVEAFKAAHAHREFSRTPRPLVLGAPKANVRARFIRNRHAAARRRWELRHGRAIDEARAVGKSLDEAVELADQVHGAEPPTLEELERELREAGEIPATMLEDEEA